MDGIYDSSSRRARVTNGFGRNVSSRSATFNTPKGLSIDKFSSNRSENGSNSLYPSIQRYQKWRLALDVVLAHGHVGQVGNWGAEDREAGLWVVSSEREKKNGLANIDPSKVLAATITYHLRPHTALARRLRERRRQIALRELLALGNLGVLFKPH